MGRMFGTDGVRGLANAELTPELAFQLGRASGSLLAEKKDNGNTGAKTKVVIGRDTRLSGTMLEGALVAGLCSAGVDVYIAGVIPTPAVAFLVRDMKADAGAVISASHNPSPDNGIKFFNSRGFKLDDRLEDDIEAIIQNGLTDRPRPTGDGVGRVIPLTDAEDRYINFLKGTIEGDLNGIKIAVDCAHGAASRIAPRLFRELGAQVISLYDLPDGLNINAGCGSTHPESLAAAVTRFGARLGLAYDGDADRVIAVDEKGQIINGDQILVACGLHLHKQAKMNGQVVVTVMSNLGLKQAFEKAGIKVWETTVGDRYVLEKMVEQGAPLGGEQSGHIIFLNHNTTGDGLLTSLQLLATIRETGLELSELAGEMQVLPQVLLNVRVGKKEGWEDNAVVRETMNEVEKILLHKGRLLVRASGTEPLIRVMAEGPDREELEKICTDLAQVIQCELGS